MPRTNAQDRGNRGEDTAVAYLENLGYRILHRNFTFGKLELDIVARDGKELVFVEVKTRSSSRYLAPEDALTPSKQALLRRAADAYFQVWVRDLTPCRFDVIAIVDDGVEMEIRHIKNAFT